MIDVMIVSTLSFYINPRTTGNWCDKQTKAMERDFKECIIRLMQHPIMCKPISELTTGEQEYAYDLLSDLFDFSIEE